MMSGVVMCGACSVVSDEWCMMSGVSVRCFVYDEWCMMSGV